MPKTTFLLTALALWWLWLYRTRRPLPGSGAAPAAGLEVPPAAPLPAPLPPGIVPILPPVGVPPGYNIPGSVLSP